MFFNPQPNIFFISKFAITKKPPILYTPNQKKMRKTEENQNVDEERNSWKWNASQVKLQ